MRRFDLDDGGDRPEPPEPDDGRWLPPAAPPDPMRDVPAHASAAYRLAVLANAKPIYEALAVLGSGPEAWAFVASEIFPTDGANRNAHASLLAWAWESPANLEREIAERQCPEEPYDALQDRCF